MSKRRLVASEGPSMIQHMIGEGIPVVRTDMGGVDHLRPSPLRGGRMMGNSFISLGPRCSMPVMKREESADIANGVEMGSWPPATSCRDDQPSAFLSAGEIRGHGIHGQEDETPN